MAYSYVTYTGNGATTQYSVPFPYIRKEHIYVSINQVAQTYTWVNNGTVQLATAPANGAKVEVRRSTPASAALVDFTDGSTPVAADFDTSNLQHLYLEQELLDNQGQTVSVNPTTGLPTLNGARLTNVGSPVDSTDAATKGYVDANVATAAADAAAAAASAALANDWATKTSGTVAGGEYSAKYHAQQAATSAGTATTQASNAATSASNAATQASNASASAVSAAASAASAATLLDNFDDRYLGTKASDPTLDNDGNALVIGALYFNSTTGRMRVYTSLGWVDTNSNVAGIMNTFEFVATGGQTTFSGNDANGSLLSYTQGALIVSLNGAVLRPGDDYTATNGTSIVLLSAATAGDELQVMAFGNFNVASHYSKTEADALFQTIAAMSAYLTTAAAASTYVKRPKAFFYAGF